jgi:hypothetical protein
MADKECGTCEHGGKCGCSYCNNICFHCMYGEENGPSKWEPKKMEENQNGK